MKKPKRKWEKLPVRVVSQEKRPDDCIKNKLCEKSKRWLSAAILSHTAYSPHFDCDYSDKVKSTSTIEDNSTAIRSTCLSPEALKEELDYITAIIEK